MSFQFCHPEELGLAERHWHLIPCVPQQLLLRDVCDQHLFSQPGVRANQPGSCSVMPGAFRQCHCGFGHTHSQIPNHVGLAAPMPETLLVTSQHLALSAAPWDIWLRNTLDPSVSSQTLFAYKMSHPYPAPTARGCGHPGVSQEYSIAPAVPLSGSRIQASRSVPPSVPSLSPPRSSALRIHR